MLDSCNPMRAVLVILFIRYHQLSSTCFTVFLLFAPLFYYYSYILLHISFMYVLVFLKVFAKYNFCFVKKKSIKCKFINLVVKTSTISFDCFFYYVY